jgi:hypothetical protein
MQDSLYFSLDSEQQKFIEGSKYHNFIMEQWNM